MFPTHFRSIYPQFTSSCVDKSHFCVACGRVCVGRSNSACLIAVNGIKLSGNLLLLTRSETGIVRALLTTGTRKLVDLYFLAQHKRKNRSDDHSFCIRFFGGRVCQACGVRMTLLSWWNFSGSGPHLAQHTVLHKGQRCRLKVHGGVFAIGVLPPFRFDVAHWDSDPKV